MYLLDALDKVFNRLQMGITWGDVKLNSQQKSNLALAMLILERCRLWSLLTSELALYNAGLEPTRPLDSFYIPLAFHDRAKVPDSLRHGTSGVIDCGVGESVGRELVTDRVTSHCSVEGGYCYAGEGLQYHSKERGYAPIFRGAGFLSLQFFFLGDFTNFFLLLFSGMSKKRSAMMIDIDVDCDKVNELLKKRKKKKSSKVHLSKKTPR